MEMDVNLKSRSLLLESGGKLIECMHLLVDNGKYEDANKVIQMHKDLMEFVEEIEKNK